MNFTVYSQGREITDKALLKKFDAEETGVFETLRTYGGRIFRENEHLKRLSESAKTAGYLPAPDSSELSKEMRAAVSAFRAGHAKAGQKPDVVVRLNLWRNKVWVMVGKRVHPPGIYKSGVRLRTSPVKRSLSNSAAPEAKTFAYQNGILAGLEPVKGGIYEWVILDRNGLVTEVSVGNIFIVRQKRGRRPRIETPPLQGILNGVTRRFVIECALQAGFSVAEGPLMRHEIFNAEEAFLTNTSWEILPVSELDGRKIGRVPGKTTQTLQSLFNSKTREECS